MVDVGSHFGYYSLLSASIGCSFSAFEPVPTFGALLGLNVHLNNIHDVGNVYRYAVGVQKGVVRMAVPSKGKLGLAHIVSPVSSNQEWRTIEVPISTLDQLLDSRNDSPICGIKIDVEGKQGYNFASNRMSSYKRNASRIDLEQMAWWYLPSEDGCAVFAELGHGVDTCAAHSQICGYNIDFLG